MKPKALAVLLLLAATCQADASPAWNAQDAAAVAKMARSPDRDTRAAAVGKLEDVALLSAIAQNDPDAGIRENAVEERKPKDTEEQFIYKARKKAIGPFKQRMWSISEDRRKAIGQSLEERFTFLMKQLKIEGTSSVVAKLVKVPQVPLDRDAEIVAAGGTITASEKKAEGLAD